MKLEVVVVPVADVDRAKDFYTRLGWRQDAEFVADDGFHILQLTPPGSPCSIIFGAGVTDAPPGSATGLHLVVSDIEAARTELADRGAPVSEVFHDTGGVFHHAGTTSRLTGAAPDHASYGSFLTFDDPDGNTWFLQEVTTRLPGRVTSGPAYASSSDLAGALRRAAAAHGKHEAETGRPDPDWPDWYAQYMADEQAGRPAQAADA